MHRSMLGFSAVLALSLPPLAAAQETAAPAPTAQAVVGQAERIETAIGQYDEAYAKFLKAYRAAEDEEAADKVVEELLPNSGEVCAELMAAAALDHSSESAAEALAWVVQQGSPMGEDRGVALALLTEHHAGAPDAVSLLNVLTRSGDSAGEAYALAVLAQNEDPPDKGQAHMALGKILIERHKVAAQIVKAGGTDGVYLGSIQADLAESLSKLDKAGLDALEKQAHGHFQAIIDSEEMSAVKNGRSTLGQQAKAVMFEARFLSIGKTAPEIEGIDSAEVAFQLSDYRGQVVLLDFWGDW